MYTNSERQLGKKRKKRRGKRSESRERKTNARTDGRREALTLRIEKKRVSLKI